MDATKITHYLENSRLSMKDLEMYASKNLLKGFIDSMNLNSQVILAIILGTIALLLGVLGFTILQSIPKKTKLVKKEFLGGFFLLLTICFTMLFMDLVTIDKPTNEVALVENLSEKDVSGYYEFYTFDETEDSYILGVEDEYTINSDKKVQEPLTYELSKEDFTVEIIYTPKTATFGDLFSFKDYLANSLGKD